MARRSKETLEKAHEILEEFGARVVATSTTGGSHQRLDFVVAGRRGFVVVAFSTGDKRSHLAMRTSIKRRVQAVRDGLRGGDADADRGTAAGKGLLRGAGRPDARARAA